MRALHVYRTYFPDPPGGGQEVIRNIALSTKNHGVESRIFTLSPTPDPRIVTRPEGDVIRSRSWIAPASCDIGGIDSFATFRQLATWADVVHFHFPWPFLDLLRFVMPRHKPTVMTYHSDIVRQRLLGTFYAPLMRVTLHAMDRVVVASPNYAASSEVLKAHVRPDQLRIIPFGIEERPALQVSTNILQRLNVAPESYFLFVGVLRYYKGLHTLIRAAQTVNAPPIKIVIAGSGGEEQNLRALANELGTTNVIFAGQVSNDEKTELLQHCKAFVFPSHLRSEAFGISLVEAAMLAKPMISCEIGTGTSYVNLNDVTGITIPPENPPALAAAMNRLLSNPDQTAQFGINARKRYIAEFVPDVMGKRYADLYREIVQ